MSKILTLYVFHGIPLKSHIYRADILTKPSVFLKLNEIGVYMRMSQT